MRYIAFVRRRSGFDRPEFAEKSKRWWNDGEAPEGLKTLAAWHALGSRTPSVFVFECDDHEALHRLLEFWNELEFELHPARDLLEQYRAQGMHVA